MRTLFMRKRRLVLTSILATTCLLQSVELPLATTTTTTFTVSITLTATCTITSASALNFGSTGIRSTAIPRRSTINVICSSGTGYNIGLDVGTGAGATYAARKMTNSGNTVTYSLYRDAAHTQVWGETISKGDDKRGILGVGRTDGQALQDADDTIAKDHDARRSYVESVIQRAQTLETA